MKYCGNCGSQLNDDAKFCSSCGQEVVDDNLEDAEYDEEISDDEFVEDSVKDSTGSDTQFSSGSGSQSYNNTHQTYAQHSSSTTTYNDQSKPPYVDTHLAKAILTAILCCMPFGIVAIVYASSVNTKLLVGDIAGAKEASNKANIWSNWGIGIGAVFMVVYFAFIITMALMGELY